MGFFSGDETIYVASVVYPLGEEPDKIPDLVKANVIAAGIRGSSVPYAIKDTIFNGLGVKITQAYHYAAQHYWAGLPQGIPLTTKDAAQENLVELLCEEWLTDLYPLNVVDVVNVILKFSDNFETIVRQQIETLYSYDFYQQATYAATGAVDVGAELTDYTSLPPDDVLHPDQNGYRLAFTNPDLTLEIVDIWFANTLFDGEEPVVHRIMLEVTFDGGPTKTLSYKFGDGNSRLNLYLRNLETPQSGTFPTIVLKKPKQAYLNQDAFSGGPWKTSVQYRTSKRYAERLGLNIDDLIAMIKDNPNETDIDYAFIQPGTMLQATNQAVVEYHFNYFNRLRLNFGDNKPAVDAWIAKNHTKLVKGSGATGCPAQLIYLKDPDATEVNNTLNITLSWRYITYEEKTGTLTQPYEVECGANEYVWAQYPGPKALRTVSYDMTKVYFRKRLTPTTYAELVVVGPRHTNYVYKGEKVISKPWYAFNDPENEYGGGFIIPLDYDTFISLSARSRLQLAQECIHVVFNCYEVVKEKWYQTGFFKLVTFIIAALIIVYTWGAGSGWVNTFYNGVKVALEASLGPTVAAAVAMIITVTVIVGITAGVQYVAKEVGEWAAEKWGAAWGAVASIVVTIALSYGISSGMKGYMGSTTTAPAPIGVAEQVLNAASYVIMGMSTFTQYEYEALRQEQKLWTDYVNSPDNPLTEVNKKLEEMFPEMTWLQEAFLAPRETLDEFLGRTLTLTDGLTGRLFLPVSNLSELTLTPRLS